MSPNVLNVPIFGTRLNGYRYVVRPSAYALIENGLGQYAVVATPMGYFLPSGGIEGDEDPQRAIEREVFEECGLRVRSSSIVAQAIQLTYSKDEDTHFEKPTWFLSAIVEDSGAPSSEADHQLLWLQREAAVKTMTHESHAWILRNAAQPGVEPDGSLRARRLTP